VSITKLVVLLTRNLAKSSLQFAEFSTISREFTRFSKCATLLKLPFCTRGPTKIWNITTVPLVCEKHPRKKRGLAMWPLAMGAARLRRFRRGRRRSRPGRGARRRVSSPRNRGCSKFGRRGTRQRQRPQCAVASATAHNARQRSDDARL
jgi:hypothetical protein